MKLMIVDTPGYMTFKKEQQDSTIVFKMVEKTHNGGQKCT